MTKREYATKVAKLISDDSTVTEVVKNGVTLTAVSVPRMKKDGATIAATLYIDENFDNEVDVEDCANQFKETLENAKEDEDLMGERLEIVQNFEKAKDLLSIRLYNANVAEHYELHRSAEDFGFDDLIMVPMVCGDSWSSVVRKHILEGYGITEDELFDICINNIKDDVEIVPMSKLLMEMMHIETEEEARAVGLDVDNEEQLYVISNGSKHYGATAVLFANDKLEEIFPNGYAILPSSIHEVIACPLPDDLSVYNNMVNDVNESEVLPEEILGNKAYLFEK